MKTIRYIWLVFCTMAQAFGQPGFEYVFDCDRVGSFADSKIDHKGNCILVSYRFLPGTISPDASIIKVSPSGDTLSRVFNFGDTLCYFNTVEITPDNHYLAFGAIGYPESNYKKYKYIWVVKVDEELNLISEKRFQLKGEYWNPLYETLMQKDSVIYAAGHCSWFLPGQAVNLLMGKFDLYGDTIRIEYPDFQNPVTYHEVNSAVNPGNNCEGMLVHGYGLDKSYGTIIELDSSLNSVHYNLTVPDYYAYALGNLRRLDEDHYFFITNATFWGKGDKNIMILKMNNSHTWEDTLVFGRIDTSDYSAWRKAIDFVYKDKIYVAAQLEHFPDSPVDCSVFVSLIDSALNLKGMKFYGGDKNYSLFTVSATADGGCILGGSICDWQNPPEGDVDLWVKKIFPEDILTPAEDTPDPYDLDYIVYPNPGKESLSIQTARKDLEIILYDNTGKIVLQETVNSFPVFTVNTSFLAPGLYTCGIRDKAGNRLIGSGKWVKE